MLTVKQLIEQLNERHPDSNVYIHDAATENDLPVAKVGPQGYGIVRLQIEADTEATS